MMGRVLRCVVWCMIVLVAATVGSLGASQGRRVLREIRANDSARFARVTTDGQTLVEIGRPSGQVDLSVSLRHRLEKLADLRFAADSRVLVLIGDEGPAKSLILIDADRGAILSEVETQSIALSPSTALAVFQPFSVGKPAAEYRVTVLSGRSPQGVRFFPSDAFEHEVRSELQWISGDTVAFLDMSREHTSVVAARFNTSGALTHIVTKRLDETELVDATTIGDAKPAWVLTGATISRLDEPGLSLRLKFPERVGLRVRRIDMKLW